MDLIQWSMISEHTQATLRVGLVRVRVSSHSSDVKVFIEHLCVGEGRDGYVDMCAGISLSPPCRCLGS